MEENLRLCRLEVRMDIARDYVIDVLTHDSFPKIDRTLCLILNIDYDEVMLEKEAMNGEL